MNLTWLGTLAVVWLVIMFLRGYSRGLVKEIVSLVFLLFSLTLVWMVNPYVSQFIKENTMIYQKVQESSREIVERNLEKSLQQKGATQREIQQGVVDQLPLPKFLKNQLKEDNRSDVYRYLNVKNFTEYIADYLTRIVMNGMSFIISFIIVSVVLNIIAGVLNLVAKLPILNGINRLAGACLGGIKGLAGLWIVLLLLTLFYSTEFGKAGMRMVMQDRFLSFLYENNIFIKIFMNIFHGHA